MLNRVGFPGFAEHGRNAQAFVILSDLQSPVALLELQPHVILLNFNHT
jgi:hypothetical protein